MNPSCGTPFKEGLRIITASSGQKARQMFEDILLAKVWDEAAQMNSLSGGETMAAVGDVALILVESRLTEFSEAGFTHWQLSDFKVRCAAYVPFRKGLNAITGKTSKGKALPAFKAYLANEIRITWKKTRKAANEEKVRALVDEHVYAYSKTGFTREQVSDLEKAYRALPRRAQRVSRKQIPLTAPKKRKSG